MDTINPSMAGQVAASASADAKAPGRMSAKKMMDASLPLRERLLEFALEQGPLTVVFFICLGGAIYKGDTILQRIEAGYERNAKDLLKVTEEHTKATGAIIQQWKEDRTLLMEVLRRDHEIMRNHGMVDGNGSAPTN